MSELISEMIQTFVKYNFQYNVSYPLSNGQMMVLRYPDPIKEMEEVLAESERILAHFR